MVNLFVEGTIGYSSYSKGGGDAYEAGIKPGLAVKLSDHVNFITKAQELYGYIEKGTPVICYHLAGTERSTESELEK